MNQILTLQKYFSYKIQKIILISIFQWNFVNFFKGMMIHFKIHASFWVFQKVKSEKLQDLLTF